MELKEGMSLFTSNGELVVGKINHFVIDPVTDEVTHLIIEKGDLLSEDKVLPFELVTPIADDRLVLKEDTGSLDKLQPFEERYFVRANEKEENTVVITHPALQADSTYYWYPSFEQEAPERLAIIKQNIPENKVLLKEGIKVLSSDGKHVGDVERLLFKPALNTATHFVISQGLLFKDRKLVPVHWVKSFEEDKVTLAVSSQLLEGLPSYES